MSYESIGGSDASAARWSAASTPASAEKVAYQSHSVTRPPYLGEGVNHCEEGVNHYAYQSHSVTRPPYFTPRIAGGTKPPETKALPRMPPSQLFILPPLSG